jgi:hypothetical protein
VITGVHELQELLAFVLVVDVEDDHALREADLRRGEPDAGRRVHGLDHVVERARDGAVDVVDVARDLLQTGSGYV